MTDPQPTPFPSVLLPETRNLQDGYLGQPPNFIHDGGMFFLTPAGERARLSVPYHETVFAVGNDLAVLHQGDAAFEGFSVVEHQDGVPRETPVTPITGLQELNNLRNSGVCSMDGAFAFLGRGADGQVLTLVKRGAEGRWAVAMQAPFAGRSLVMTMEAPERLWMVRIQGNIDRHTHRKSTLQELVLANGKVKATKLKVAFPDTQNLAASCGGTFYFHDTEASAILVYESGVKVQELPIPGGHRLYRYASAPDRFVVHGFQVSDPKAGYLLGFRREGGKHVPWFNHTSPQVEVLAVMGNAVWHSGLTKRFDVFRADLA